jgi:hypothetical protein
MKNKLLTAAPASSPYRHVIYLGELERDLMEELQTDEAGVRPVLQHLLDTQPAEVFACETRRTAYQVKCQLASGRFASTLN